MKCTYCGADVQDGEFCPFCGAQFSSQAQPAAPSVAPSVGTYGYAEAYPQANVAEKLVSAFRSQNFFLACILMTAYCVLSFLVGLTSDTVSVPVFEVLFAVFFWLLHLNAKKGVLSGGKLKALVTTVRVHYILSLVGAIIAAVAGLIITVFFQSALLLPGGVGWWGEFWAGSFSIIGLTQIFFGVGLICLAWFVLKKIAEFAESVYISVESNAENYAFVTLTRKAFFVLGTLFALGAVFSLTASFLSALSGGAYAASLIFLALWIGEHFEA